MTGTTGRSGVSRRWVLRTGAAAAGGLVLGSFASSGTGAADDAGGDLPEALNAWIAVEPDGTVAAWSAFTEIGQGIHTLVAALVAEELALDPARVAVRMAPVDPAYENPFLGSMTTGGSTSARAAFPALRQAAAGARVMLQEAAARRWDCPVAACIAANGSIRNTGTGAVLGFGELAAAAARLPPPREVPLRPRRYWKVLGHPQKRTDSPAKLAGTARFGIDTARPGMLLASVVNCPTAGGRLRGIDPAPALALAGVLQVLPLPAAVIVIADSFWTAERGAAALRPDWDPGPLADLDSEAIAARLQAAMEAPGLPAADGGSAGIAAARVVRSLRLDHAVPLLAHAPLEPANATAEVGPERVDIWAPTQAQGSARDAVAAALGRPATQVRIHTTLAGGSFGRNLDVRVVVQAALAARAAGRPVKLIWSRAQDMRHDTYRPPAASSILVGLDREGLPVRWQQRLAVPDLRQVSDDFAGSRSAAGADPEAIEGADRPPYGFLHHRLTWHPARIGVPIGWWRSVGHSFNAWFVEHALDEVAHEAGRDPVALRRHLLQGRADHLAVLDAVAAMWTTPAAAGRFRGTAIHASFGSIVAQSLELSLAPGGPKVHRVNCAVDCGIALDPDAVAAQIEGAVIFGLTAALYGEIGVQNGRVRQGNFDSYRLLPLADTPEIAVRILPTASARIGGIGEAGLPPVAPALCNALLAATGKGCRRLPVRLP